MKLMELSVVLLGGLLLHSSGHAAGMQIKTGEWEFRSQTSMPGQNVARDHVDKQCLKDETITPEVMMKGMQQGCELSDFDSTAHSMSWKVQCSNKGGEMTGAGNVSGSGETLKGGMEMAMTFNGQTMNMAVSWDGKYIGPCP